MFKEVSRLLQRPKLYANTEAAFWDDEHISKQMLKAHLDPNFEGASRKREFIEKSVAWIKNTAPPSRYPTLLDVGCGPGLYAERFTRAGYRVTGIDFSKRSINYAKRSAAVQELEISYDYQDYLTMDLQEAFHFAVMIYCDYGVLSVENRKIIMQNVYRALKPGGKLLLDVFSMARYHSFEEKQSWEICGSGGFWREGPYAVFSNCCRYPEHVTLEQIAVVSDQETAAYYLWNCCFTRDLLITEAKEAGFQICELFADVAGAPYSESSHTIAILLEK